VEAERSSFFTAGGLEDRGLVGQRPHPRRPRRPGRGQLDPRHLGGGREHGL